MNEKKGILFILATAVISGVSIYINSLAVKFSNPYVFTGVKNVLVGAALFSIILAVKEFKSLRALNQKDWLKLMFVGLVGGAIPFMLFFKGLTMTTAVQGGLIQKCMFVFVAFLAAMFLKEKWNKSIFFGLVAILIGNILFSGISPHSFGKGDWLIVLATLLWSVEIVISKKLLARLPSSTVAWSRMFFGGLFIFIYLIMSRQIQPLFDYQTVQWKWIAITSVFLLGYVWTLYTGLKYVRASVATAVLALGAPITSLTTLIATGQVKLASGQIWGTGLIIVGLTIMIGFNIYKKSFTFT
ncbi:MAG: DMT family transporter, partial [Patescibacteria group bacterium]